MSYEPILEGSGGAGGGANGRRRKGSASGFSWFDPSQPGTEAATASSHNPQQHSWLRPMTWNWGSQGQGGPGAGTGAGAVGNGAAPYRPPQPGQQQSELDGRLSQLPPWMTSTAGVAAYRPYDDDDSAGGGGAIA